MAFSADDLRDIIEAQWNLTGELSKTASDTMRETVKFYSRPQISGTEVTKAVEVVKDAKLENEIVEQHPKFSTKTDVFLITLKYRAVDIQEATYNDALSNVQAMQEELIQILKTQFDPSSTTGVFSTTNRQWAILDNYNTAQPELIRQLTFRLTEVRSENNAVFRGYGGVLVFDTSESIGDNKPASDFTYTEVYNMRKQEGYNTLPVLTNDATLGIGVPKLERGQFAGTFSAQLYADTTAFGATLDKLDKIFLAQSNGQLAIVTLIASNPNPNGQVLQNICVIKVTRMERFADDEGLVTFTINGALVKPSTYLIV